MFNNSVESGSSSDEEEQSSTITRKTTQTIVDNHVKSQKLSVAQQVCSLLGNVVIAVLCFVFGHLVQQSYASGTTTPAPLVPGAFAAPTAAAPLGCDEPWSMWFFVMGGVQLGFACCMIPALGATYHIATNRKIATAGIYNQQGRAREAQQVFEEDEDDTASSVMASGGILAFTSFVTLCCLLPFVIGWAIYGVVLAVSGHGDCTTAEGYSSWIGIAALILCCLSNLMQCLVHKKGVEA